MAKNIIFGLVLLLLSVALYYKYFMWTPTNFIDLKIKDQQFTLEVANTLAQKSRGLMYRDSLKPDAGMIFISPSPSIQYFWMKNTKIPLDIIFLKDDGSVINIEKAYPQPNTPDINLRLYQSLGPAKFVIELNLDTTQKIQLVPGDKISLDPLLDFIKKIEN